MTLLCEYRRKESAHLSLFRVAIKRRYAKIARYLEERTPIINKKKLKYKIFEIFMQYKLNIWILRNFFPVRICNKKIINFMPKITFKNVRMCILEWRWINLMQLSPILLSSIEVFGTFWNPKKTFQNDNKDILNNQNFIS